MDVAICDKNITKSPHVDDFIDEILPHLQILYADGPKDIDPNGKESKETKMEVDQPNSPVGKTTDLMAVVEISASNKEPRDLALRLLKTGKGIINIVF
jgi:hypothetical protein